MESSPRPTQRIHRKGVPTVAVPVMKKTMHPHPGFAERLSRVLPHPRGGCLVWILWALTSTLAMSAAEFPKVFNTQEETIPLVPAAEAVKRMHLPPGFQATLFAGEPDVQQPMAMTTDARGRLWVAENYTYSENPVNYHPNLRDRIVIFEDTDNDGHFDKRTVFWDQATRLTSIAVGFGGVYALCPPNLVFIPDHNQDDIPDGAPEVLLEGWNDFATRHTIVNGLKWGPDGWLYGRQGIQVTSEVGKPGSPKDQRARLNAGIWRFHPVTHQFDIVAEGTTNPWGHDWDDYGQLFFINTVIGHLWHVVPGAYYRRMYGEHFNPHLYELIEQTADHFHWDTREVWHEIRKIGVSPGTSQAGGGHAHCGFMIYLGDNWPAEYRNSAFAVNYHGKRVNHDVLERRGAGYVGKHAPDFLTFDDPWFRGIDLLYGPDGGVYLTDWSDIGECHDNEGIHRTSGRIYKITYGPPRPARSLDLSSLSVAALAGLQTHTNEWFSRQARTVLQARAARGVSMADAHSALRTQFDTAADVRHKLRALWTLHATGGADIPWLTKQLKHPEEHVRLWALRCLVDQRPAGSELLNELAQQAPRETSGLVLAFMASALRDAPLDSRWRLATALASRSDYAADATFPLLLWYGIQPAVLHAPEAATELALGSQIPKIRRFITRHLSEDWELHAPQIQKLVAALSAAGSANRAADLIEGMAEALRGRRKASAPLGWQTLVTSLEGKLPASTQKLLLEISTVFGDGRATGELREIVKNTAADLGARRHALEALTLSRADALLPLITPLLTEMEIAPDAIRALATLGTPETPSIVVNGFGSLRSPLARTEAINALSSRIPFAKALLDAIGAGKIGRKEVGPLQVRQLRSLEDVDITRRVSELWPEYRPLSADKQRLLTLYRARLTPETIAKASLEHGRSLFVQSCGACHKLFGEGGQIGPDLTGSDRKNLGYLLENILDPSAMVPESYRVSVITLRDDRVINGIVGASNDRLMVVQTPTERLTLERKEIESVKPSALSMMPEGLLEGLSENDQRDLIAYLQSR